MRQTDTRAKVIIAVGSILLIACGLTTANYVDHTGGTTAPTPAPGPTPSPGTTPTVTYANGAKAALTANCAKAGCHITGGQSPDLSTYASAAAGGPRSLIRINAGTMPPGGGLGAADKATLVAWAAANFPQ